MPTRKFINLGRIIRAHGVHGAMLALIYNQSTEILASRHIWLKPPGSEPVAIPELSVKTGPKGLIIKIKNITTREAADALKGAELVIDRANLPEPEDDEYYQADLLHLEAETTTGRPLGHVINFLDSGAGLVLIIQDESGHENMIPFNDQFISEVNLETGCILIEEVPGLLNESEDQPCP